MLKVLSPCFSGKPVVLAAFLATCLFALSPVPAHAQPNIIHIIADDFSWVDLSSNLTNNGNGSAYYQTPNIDALASGGMAFTSAYANPNCAPTRAAVMTGQYAPNNGVHNVDSLNRGGNSTLLRGPSDNNHIQNSAVALGEVLQGVGYRTAHVGKFHSTLNNSDIVNNHGFNVNYGGTNVGSPNNYDASFNNGAGQWQYGNKIGPELDQFADPYTQQYINDNLLPYANGNNPNSLLGDPKHLSDASADAAIDFLGDFASGGAHEGTPFFMNLAFHAVHTPINSRDDLQAKYQALPTSSDPDHDSANYAGLVEGMDQAIGRVVDFVQDNGLGNDTLIVFYSDNGGHEGPTDNAPLRGRKGMFTEGGIRVPLIAYMPGTIAAGSSSDEAIAPVDFYTTYAELAGAGLPDPATHTVDGESFAGILTGTDNQLDRRSIFYHFPGYLDSRAVPTSTIIHDAPDGDRYKLLYFYEDRRYELYNLTDDFTESNELIGSGAMSQQEFTIANQMSKELNQWLIDNGALQLTVRGTGAVVPFASAAPAVAFNLGSTGLGASLDGLTTSAVDLLGVTLTLTADGPNAVFDTNTTGLGVNSSADAGSDGVQRRIDGTAGVGEGLLLSFDQDVLLKSITLGAFSTTGNETALLEFITGDNPFDGLSGYNSGIFDLTADTLAMTVNNGSATPLTIDFATLAQDEILITAGTVLRLTSDPATSGGFLFNGLEVGLALEDIELIPEPGTLMLLASGGLLMLRRRRG